MNCMEREVVVGSLNSEEAVQAPGGMKLVEQSSDKQTRTDICYTI